MNDEQQITCDEDHLQMARLRAIMHRLRAKDGCAWDAMQTHQSLIPNMIEEAFEAVDAIRKKDFEHMREELGDVLLQVVFHAELARESGNFNFDDVARTVSDKLIRRHPHVYADSSADSPQAVLDQWDEIKKTEKTERTEKEFLEGVGSGLPASLRAVELQKKASKAGFDWPDTRSILAKIEEEFNEVKTEFEQLNSSEEIPEALKDELGDLLFAIVNMARKLKLSPEDLIDRTNQKFIHRFALVERKLESEGLSLAPENRAKMEQFWLDAKEELTSSKFRRKL